MAPRFEYYRNFKTKLAFLVQKISKFSQAVPNSQIISCCW